MRVLPILNREYKGNTNISLVNSSLKKSKATYFVKSNSNSMSFKASKIQIKEPINFKTKGIFSMLKDIFEAKSNLLANDIQLFKEKIQKECPKCEMRFQIPVLGITSFSYDNIFQLLRVPVNNLPKYLMLITSNNQQKKVEITNEELIADFDSKEFGISLNEYVSLGLESQFQQINNQENLKRIEEDYCLRDSKLSEYVDNGLHNIQKQINDLIRQVNQNSMDIKSLQSGIESVNISIQKLRKDLKTTGDSLAASIHAVDTKYLVSVSPDWCPEYNALYDVASGEVVFPEEKPCWDFIKK